MLQTRTSRVLENTLMDIWVQKKAKHMCMLTRWATISFPRINLLRGISYRRSGQTLSVPFPQRLSLIKHTHSNKTNMCTLCTDGRCAWCDSSSQKYTNLSDILDVTQTNLKSGNFLRDEKLDTTVSCCLSEFHLHNYKYIFEFFKYRTRSQGYEACNVSRLVISFQVQRD
jgi:hypothetical protein